MIDISGATGRLKVLVDRLSVAWAAKLDALYTGLSAGTRMANLDRLDANVSATAPASTALNNAVWTNAKAGFLDAAISSAVRIKSIQVVEVSMSSPTTAGSAAITAVTVAKTILIPSGHVTSEVDYTSPSSITALWSLLSATSVSLVRGAGNGNMTGRCFVVEFY